MFECGHYMRMIGSTFSLKSPKECPYSDDHRNIGTTDFEVEDSDLKNALFTLQVRHKFSEAKSHVLPTHPRGNYETI